jgi:hypothetical protein
VALADSVVKRQVAHDMDASPWTENKLVVPAYFESEGGQLLAERVNELLPNELQDVIECLPPLDFYLPVPSHREVWDIR